MTLSPRERALLALGTVGFFAGALCAPERGAGVPVLCSAGACGAVAIHLVLKVLKGAPLDVGDMCH